MCPVSDVDAYNRMLDLAKAEKRITTDEQADSLNVKRAVLRFVMSVEDLVEYFQVLENKGKSDLHSMHKMEMSVICLLHLEMRVGENILTSICQRMINMVSIWSCPKMLLIVTLLISCLCILAWKNIWKNPNRQNVSNNKKTALWPQDSSADGERNKRSGLEGV